MYTCALCSISPARSRLSPHGSLEVVVPRAAWGVLCPGAMQGPTMPFHFVAPIARTSKFDWPKTLLSGHACPSPMDSPLRLLAGVAALQSCVGRDIAPRPDAPVGIPLGRRLHSRVALALLANPRAHPDLPESSFHTANVHREGPRGRRTLERYPRRHPSCSVSLSLRGIVQPIGPSDSSNSADANTTKRINSLKSTPPP